MPEVRDTPAEQFVRFEEGLARDLTSYPRPDEAAQRPPAPVGATSKAQEKRRTTEGSLELRNPFAKVSLPFPTAVLDQHDPSAEAARRWHEDWFPFPRGHSYVEALS